MKKKEATPHREIVTKIIFKAILLFTFLYCDALFPFFESVILPYQGVSADKRSNDRIIERAILPSPDDSQNRSDQGGREEKDQEWNSDEDE
jgi:hypothetical protein